MRSFLPVFSSTVRQGVSRDPVLSLSLLLKRVLCEFPVPAGSCLCGRADDLGGVPDCPDLCEALVLAPVVFADGVVENGSRLISPVNTSRISFHRVFLPSASLVTVRTTLFSSFGSCFHSVFVMRSVRCVSTSRISFHRVFLPSASLVTVRTTLFLSFGSCFHFVFSCVVVMFVVRLWEIFHLCPCSSVHDFSAITCPV